TPGGTLRATLDHPAAVTAAELGPDGEHVATAAADGDARLWSAAGALRWTVTGSGAALDDVGFNADGSQVVSAGPENHARTLEAANGRELRSIELAEGERVRSAQLPEGALPLLLHGNWSAKLWTAHDAVELPLGLGPILARLSPAGDRVATMAAD